MSVDAFAKLIRPGTQRISYRHADGRRVEVLWQPDGTADVRFWSGGENRPYIHRGISAAKVEEAALKWKEIGSDG